MENCFWENKDATGNHKVSICSRIRKGKKWRNNLEREFYLLWFIISEFEKKARKSIMILASFPWFWWLASLVYWLTPLTIMKRKFFTFCGICLARRDSVSHQNYFQCFMLMWLTSLIFFRREREEWRPLTCEKGSIFKNCVTFNVDFKIFYCSSIV